MALRYPAAQGLQGSKAYAKATRGVQLRDEEEDPKEIIDRNIFRRLKKAHNEQPSGHRYGYHRDEEAELSDGEQPQDNVHDEDAISREHIDRYLNNYQEEQDAFVDGPAFQINRRRMHDGPPAFQQHEGYDRPVSRRGRVAAEQHFASSSSSSSQPRQGLEIEPRPERRVPSPLDAGNPLTSKPEDFDDIEHDFEGEDLDLPDERVEEAEMQRGPHYGARKMPPPSYLPHSGIPRPGSSPSYFCSPIAHRKKGDVVSLGQKYRQNWGQDKFLRKSKTRKFDVKGREIGSERMAMGATLGSYMPTTSGVPPRPASSFIRPTYVPPHEKRRDDLRMTIRARMLG